MDNVNSDRTIVFFRNHSEFCLGVSKQLKENGISFIEVISDSPYQEMPCIISPRYANAFRGEIGVLNFLSLVLTKPKSELEQIAA